MLIFKSYFLPLHRAAIHLHQVRFLSLSLSSQSSVPIVLIALSQVQTKATLKFASNVFFFPLPPTNFLSPGERERGCYPSLHFIVSLSRRSFSPSPRSLSLLPALNIYALKEAFVKPHRRREEEHILILLSAPYDPT